jgi:hypothetical protein
MYCGSGEEECLQMMQLASGKDTALAVRTKNSSVTR